MPITRFIGDVHGKYRQYKQIISGCDRSVQVGDMGVGFRYYVPHDDSGLHGKIFGNPPYDDMEKGNHRFIRGNHDNPQECRKHPFFIQDGAVEDTTMYVGGALSIDRQYRIEGFSWWPDEELSLQELNQIYDVYVTSKPTVMVTHDAPDSIACLLSRKEKLEFPSRTRQAFQSMFESHRPSLWLFGHWHQSFITDIEGTRFICLAELEFLDIELDRYQTRIEER